MPSVIWVGTIDFVIANRIRATTDTGEIFFLNTDDCRKRL